MQPILKSFTLTTSDTRSETHYDAFRIALNLVEVNVCVDYSIFFSEV